MAYAVHDTEESPGHHQRADLRPVREPAVDPERGEQLRLLPEPDEMEQAVQILTEAFPGAEWTQ